MLSDPVGVGSSPLAAAVVSNGRVAAPDDGDRFTRVSLVQAVGVGSQDEEPVTEVRGADGCRGDTVPFRNPPARGQVCEYRAEAQGKVTWDVLAEEEPRVRFPDDAPDVRPEVARIADPATLAGDGEGLAWVSRSDEIHRSTPRATIEGGDVVPDRSLIQGRVCHPRHKNGRAVGLPLNSTHKAMVGSGEADAEVESADACAESEGS